MRTMLLPKYAKVPTGYVPTQIIVRDELNPGENTTQIISDLTFDALPDRIFTKAYLECQDRRGKKLQPYSQRHIHQDWHNSEVHSS